MLSYLTTFIAVFAVDFIYTYYVKSINQNKAITAGLWGAIVWLIGSFAVIEYTANHMLLIPACIGAFCGTWVGIKIRNKDDKTL
jgi:O-antigen/teichoic acid export membrane protein